MLKLPDNIPQAHFQCAGDSQQHINRGYFVPAFDLPHIDGVNVNSLRKLFLRQTNSLAILANAPAQKSAIFFRDHDWLLSQAVFGKFAQILLAIILFPQFRLTPPQTCGMKDSVSGRRGFLKKAEWFRVFI